MGLFLRKMIFILTSFFYHMVLASVLLNKCFHVMYFYALLKGKTNSSRSCRTVQVKRLGEIWQLEESVLFYKKEETRKLEDLYIFVRHFGIQCRAAINTTPEVLEILQASLINFDSD
ncbi:hypothetical protein OS493_006449 [Desmophyllum pertusum]|uniref:Uncharacterized protein n=1 Tax=Desmophyllum pertusum TaxID=174260 RepID=A0A9X0A4U0_9CNID|nr:hypothetical protein OS493_006449 [Desmophyllum pertusum]